MTSDPMQSAHTSGLQDRNDGRSGDDVVLEARAVSMGFGQVRALDDVTVHVRAGRVTCLLGDNGAGKSTLIRVLSGVFSPDSGALLLDGRTVAFRSPRDAQAHAIATVHQDLAVLPLMSIWRNFFLGHEPTLGRGPFRHIDVARCREIAREQLRAFGITIEDASRPAGTLSGGERQAVAIARALHLGARVLILDEPTAALGVRQTRLVLEKVRMAKERGAAVLLVTHNPRHAYEAGDEFVVLRAARVIASLARADASPEGLAALMMGDTQ